MLPTNRLAQEHRLLAPAASAANPCIPAAAAKLPLSVASRFRPRKLRFIGSLPSRRCIHWSCQGMFLRKNVLHFCAVGATHAAEGCRTRRAASGLRFVAPTPQAPSKICAEQVLEANAAKAVHLRARISSCAGAQTQCWVVETRHRISTGTKCCCAHSDRRRPRTVSKPAHSTSSSRTITFKRSHLRTVTHRHASCTACSAATARAPAPDSPCHLGPFAVHPAAPASQVARARAHPRGARDRRRGHPVRSSTIAAATRS